MAKCDNGKWKVVEDTCVIKVIKDLLLSSEELQVEDVPGFVGNLSVEVKKVKEINVTQSPHTISTIVEILGNIADVTLEVNQPVIEDVLQTVDEVIGEDSRESWTALNANENNNASSDLLGSMELLSDKIVGTFTFTSETGAILLNRSTFDNSFYANLNSSVVLDIPNTGFRNVSITTITLFTLNNVMPVRSSSFNTSLFNTNNTDPVNALNAAVVLIRVNETIRNVTLSYTKLNTTLTQDPQCVFWNFKLFDNRGAWDRVGTMLDSTNRGLHIVFALFNSLQGFFILVFGTLFDSKIRSILARKSPTTSTGSNTTRSTSGGISSTGMNWFHRLHVYRVSEAANSGSGGASESFSNI
ncbi:Adhesion G protein-coupled receptor F5 [Dissostichus eleginoides]|uniref:Adhesion G protein-coupled receptor F5 n=1 Tax=Dissostichus eleginoides TaxID=100907 RepID=A0AAD9B9R7_DISEL|nr:Adhesion G protein-coupled receptor F5 [Dissostichus eleginoides]